MVVFGVYDVVSYYLRESTFGTIPSSPAWQWVGSAVQNLEPTQSRNAQQIYSFDQRRDPRTQPYMQKTYDYRVAWHPDKADLLTYTLQSVNTTLSFEERWLPQAGVASDERFYRHRGCRAGRTRIQWRVGQPVLCETDFMFQEVGSAGTATNPPLYPETTQILGATYQSEPHIQNPFLFSDGFIAIDTSPPAGTFTDINVLEAEVTINNRVDRDSGFTIGQPEVASLPIGKREVSFSFTRLFEDQNQVNEFHARTGLGKATQGTQFRLRFPYGASATLTINLAKWNPLALPKDIRRDVLVFRYTGTAHQPSAGGNSVTFNPSSA